MSKPDLERLKKIKKHCHNINRTLKDVTFENFNGEDGIDIRELCAFRLFQIGEHSHKLSQDLKQQYSEFDWRAAYYFRNILGHDYESVSFNALWKSCKNKIPQLLRYVEKIISDIEPELDPPPNQDRQGEN